MKKTKLIALTMVVALMMVGAGYAAWSDQINIEANVKTGHLDVYFEDQVDEVTEANYTIGTVSYEADEDGPNDKAVISLQKVYPGAKSSVYLVLRNNSTMPVKCDTSVLPPYDGEEHANWIKNPLVKLNGSDITNPNTPIPAGDALEITFDIEIPLSEKVDQETTYQLYVKPTFEQFNQK